MAATTQALMVEYQTAIRNVQMQGRMAGIGLTFELLILTAMDMYDIWTLAKEAQSEEKLGNWTCNN